MFHRVLLYNRVLRVYNGFGLPFWWWLHSSISCVVESHEEERSGQVGSLLKSKACVGLVVDHRFLITLQGSAFQGLYALRLDGSDRCCKWNLVQGGVCWVCVPNLISNPIEVLFLELKFDCFLNWSLMIYGNYFIGYLLVQDLLFLKIIWFLYFGLKIFSFIWKVIFWSVYSSL